MPQPSGVLLVGSIPFQTEEEVFQRTCKALPERLWSIPDGETGTRENFVKWQKHAFPAEVQGPRFRDFEPDPNQVFDCTLDHINPTQYDTVAAVSYQKFCHLRSEGVIPQGVRFQVCLPGVLSVIYSHVDEKYRQKVTPLYQKRFFEDVERLQKIIPAQDLAIQVDLAWEFAVLEYSRGRFSQPFFKPFWNEDDGEVFETILGQVVTLAKKIQIDIPLGFHLCYGDVGHKHFTEPEDLGLLAKMANSLVQTLRSDRPVQWIHMPCPRGRTDPAYYDPLKELHIGQTKLFLGLVHAGDKEGTLERISVAQKVYQSFGVATECGMGRTPPADIDDIFQISKEVTDPVTA